MNIEEFRAIIEETFPSGFSIGESYHDKDSDTIGYRWVRSGWYGSYGSRKEQRPAEREPQSWLLDDVLEEVCPRITYLHYKRITAVMKEGSDYENGYYGDETFYDTRSITICALYDLLVIMGEL